jgi:hypothetical protein
VRIKDKCFLHAGLTYLRKSLKKFSLSLVVESTGEKAVTDAIEQKGNNKKWK